MSLDARVESHGPMFRPHGEYFFTVGGYKVPNLKGYLIDGENTWELVLDDRFSITVSDQELQHWLWFFANACAISAGYTHFGEGSKLRNLFETRVGIISDVDGEHGIQL